MPRRNKQKQNLGGYDDGTSDESCAATRNGHLRNARGNSSIGQRKEEKTQDEPIFWLPSSQHSYPASNNRPIPPQSQTTPLSDEETMRPRNNGSSTHRPISLRPFSALIAPKPPDIYANGAADGGGEATKGFVHRASHFDKNVVQPSSPTHGGGDDDDDDEGDQQPMPPRVALIEATTTVEAWRTYSGIAGTVAIGIGACVMAILALQLLINLNYYESPGLSGVQLPVGSTPQILRDLSTTLCSITLTLSLCAVFCSFLHFYLCLRIISHSNETPRWKERITTYQRRTVYSRALSNGGFFVGIIIYILAILTYQLLLGSIYGSSILSTVVSVIFAGGALFCIVVLGTGVYFAGLCKEISSKVELWKMEKAGQSGTLV